MVSGWKSSACRSTISETVCANPSSRRPITFMGKTQGNVSSEGCGSSGRLIVGVCMPFMWGRARNLSSRHRAVRGEPGLVVLVERVHAAEERAGLAAAHGLAVQRGDREHLLGRRGEPDLVRGAQFRLGDAAHLEVQRAL